MAILSVNPKLNRIFNEALSVALRNVRMQTELDVVYTEHGVPETGKAIHAMFVEAVQGKCKFRVFSASNEAENLYFTPSTNLLYRAVHDIDHALWYSVGRGTTKQADEMFLNCLMAKRAYDYAMSCDSYTELEALYVFFAVYHDTVGQVHYYVQNKAFCENQRALTIDLMYSCDGVRFVKHGQLNPAYAVMQNYLQECGLV